MTVTTLKILNNSNLSEIATVTGFQNTKIYEEINGRLSCDFDIVPVGDATKIEYPNIIEIEENYFLVRELRNIRTTTLSRQVNLEHISYELNDNPNKKFEGKIYTGTPTQILREILSGTRFKIDKVDFTQNVDFFTEVAEIRSRIIEFSVFIGAELKWNKFGVSLLTKRGSDNGIKLEVGKNILSLTEIVKTTAKRDTKKSYEVSIVDLNYVVDENNVPLELHSVDLGDSMKLIDTQLGIDKTDRVIAIGYDPFKKALPIIEFENSIEDYITSSTTSDNKVAVVMFDKVNESPITLTSSASSIIGNDITVVRATYFDVSITLTINVTRAGVLEGYFMLAAVRQRLTYKQTLPVGFHTITLATLIIGVQKGTHSFDFWTSFNGSGTILKDGAELIVRTTGALGGASNDSPDQNVSDIINISANPMKSDKVTISLQIPRAINIDDSIQLGNFDVIEGINIVKE